MTFGLLNLTLYRQPISHLLHHLQEIVEIHLRYLVLIIRLMILNRLSALVVSEAH